MAHGEILGPPSSLPRQQLLFRSLSCAAKLEVSNQGDFVILEMDGSDKLVVGTHPAEPEKVLAGELRLALGGVLINPELMVVPVGWIVGGRVVF